jgi:hypothetical protein
MAKFIASATPMIVRSTVRTIVQNSRLPFEREVTGTFPWSRLAPGAAMIRTGT